MGIKLNENHFDLMKAITIIILIQLITASLIYSQDDNVVEKKEEKLEQEEIKSEKKPTDNNTIDDKTKKRSKKRRGRPANIVVSFFNYLPADNFDSKSYGIIGSLTPFTFFKGKMSFDFKWGHRITQTINYFPDHVYQVSFALSFMNPDFMIRAGVSSCSDKPFNSIDETVFTAVAGYNVLNHSEHSLFLGLFYSSYGISWLPVGYNIPFPLILYIYRSNDFYFMAPLPFMLRWKITEDFSFEASYISKGKIAFNYRIIGQLVIAAEAYYLNDRIFNANRADNEEYIRYQGGKAGVRISFAFITGFFGYSFANSYLFEKPVSAKVFQYSGRNYVDIADSFVFDLGLRFGF